MEQIVILYLLVKAPTDARPPSANPLGPEPSSPAQSPLRPPLNRVDSRPSFPLPPRPGGPPQAQQRPQFQPGGPVTPPPQFAPRPGSPAPRGPIPSATPVAQQARPPPLRPLGPQPGAQQGSWPLQSPTSGQPPQRFPPPNNLQFGPRQPPQFGSPTTPDVPRSPLAQQANGAPKNGQPITGPPLQLPRQSSQGLIRGLDQINTYQNKPANLDNQSITIDNQNAIKGENGMDMPGMAKGRSYSIAAAPGAPSPLKMDDERRKSVSAIGGKIEEFSSRSPALGLIQEGKIDSKDNVRGSQESIKLNETERPESRLSSSKMSDSIIGSLSTPKKKIDDDDDVVLQNTSAPFKNGIQVGQNKTDLSDRSPSLTRSEDSPEPKQNLTMTQKSHNVPPEQYRPKTPKIESKPEISDSIMKSSQPKSPGLESKPPVPVQKKPTELNTSFDSKKSTPRKATSAPKMRPKGNATIQPKI
jgi:hypothetical protein